MKRHLGMAFGNAGVELLFAVEGFLSSLRHWLRLFAALHICSKLKGANQGCSLSSPCTVTGAWALYGHMEYLHSRCLGSLISKVLSSDQGKSAKHIALMRA